MSLNDRYCRQCGVRFEPSRSDQWFHDAKCVAQFYRDNPNPQYIHAPNTNENWHTCENCGVDYWVNDYAERGGKRAPKYHSVACKQAAYRARSKASQEQAARRSTADTGDAPKASSRQSAPPPPRQSAPPPPRQSAPPPKARQSAPPPPADGAPKWTYVGSRAKYNAPAMNEAYKILGIDHTATAAQRKAAYLKKIAEWHPDRNPSPYSTLWSQAINWAYDYLKR